jgi:hypothetical protein
MRSRPRFALGRRETLTRLERRFKDIHEMNAADVDEAIKEERRSEEAES